MQRGKEALPPMGLGNLLCAVARLMTSIVTCARLRPPIVMVTLLVGGGLILGCSSAERPVAPAVSSQPAAGVRAYLLNPLESFDLSVGAETAMRLDRGFDALVQRGEAELALQIVGELLTRNDSLRPAIVLSAQVAFIASDYYSVVDQLAPVVEKSPDYRAAALLLARSFDLLGEELAALELYRGMGSSSISERRSSALGASVLSAMTGSLDVALLNQRAEEAQGLALKMAELFPDSVESLEANRDVAQAGGDLASELEARRGLWEIVAPSRVEQKRLAELEVSLGDPTQGLEILQRLVAETPNDYDLLEALDAAKFSWRLTMLPPEVASIVESEELTRAEFATLLYWVVPGVRSGAPETARIAVDIPMGHPRRREVVRVVNMGVMPMVDQALRRFGPETKMKFRNALEILLQLPQRFGVATACSERYAANSTKSLHATCNAAVRCGLVPEVETCLQASSFDGDQAKEVIRRTLNLLGGTRP